MFNKRMLPNGDLLVTASNEGRRELRNASDPMLELLDAFRDNGFDEVQPEWIGALTSGPILAEYLALNDDGSPCLEGKVWVYRRYMLEDPMAILWRTGRVVFDLAGEVERTEYPPIGSQAAQQMLVQAYENCLR